jgi:hypothetical protein
MRSFRVRPVSDGAYRFKSVQFEQIIPQSLNFSDGDSLQVGHLAWRTSSDLHNCPQEELGHSIAVDTVPKQRAPRASMQVLPSQSLGGLRLSKSALAPRIGLSSGAAPIVQRSVHRLQVRSGAARGILARPRNQRSCDWPPASCFSILCALSPATEPQIGVSVPAPNLIKRPNQVIRITRSEFCAMLHIRMRFLIRR